MRVISLSVSGLVLVLTGLFTSAGQSRPALADLTGFSRVGTDMVFSVISNGCTSKDDFELVLNESDESEDGSVATRVELYRLKPDLCKRISFATPIIFAESELSLQTLKLTLGNPIVTLKKIKR